MNTDKVTIDGRTVEINGAKNILDLVRRVGIELPTFCYHSELSVYGACRLCLVEVETLGLVASCSTPPQNGMVIRTNTERTRRLRKMVIELLLANHDRECTTCSKSVSCKLQRLAQQFGVNEIRFGHLDRRLPKDETSLSITRDPNKCILCGDCVRMCKEVQGIGIWDFAFRGSKTVVTTAFGRDLAEMACVNCGQCVAVCPTGALTVKSEVDSVWAALHTPSKTVVVQVAPAVRVALGEEFGMSAGKIVTGKIVSAFKKLGADRIFDTTFSADMTTIEESHEFIDRLLKGDRLPLFTSCCPGWVKYCEQYHSDLLTNLSSCRSPQQMMGSLVKKHYAEKIGKKPEEIFMVSIMPCTAKKFEAKRPEFQTGESYDVDAVLTTVEAARMLKEAGISFAELEEEAFDNPLGIGTGAAVIFGATGGVMESVVRCVSGLAGGDEVGRIDFYPARGIEGIKTTEVEVLGRNLKLAVVHGLANAEKLIGAIKQGEAHYDAVEIMACPGGCVGGGGQPDTNDMTARLQRTRQIYAIDRVEQLHKPQDNYFVNRSFTEWFGGPNTKKTHHSLHTTYTPRRRMTGKPMEITNGSKSESLNVSVCVGTGCFLRGAYDILDTFIKLTEMTGLSGQINLRATFCLERCDSGVSVKVGNEVITGVTPENAEKIFKTGIAPQG